MSAERDAALLAKIAEVVEGTTGSGMVETDEMVARYVNEDAILNTATTRGAGFMATLAMRYYRTGELPGGDLTPAFGAMFLDGFIFGVMFQAERDREGAEQ